MRMTLITSSGAATLDSDLEILVSAARRNILRHSHTEDLTKICTMAVLGRRESLRHGYAWEERKLVPWLRLGREKTCTMAMLRKKSNLCRERTTEKVRFASQQHLSLSCCSLQLVHSFISNILIIVVFCPAHALEIHKI